MTAKTMPLFCPGCRMQRAREDVRVLVSRKGTNGRLLRVYRCVICLARRKVAA